MMKLMKLVNIDKERKFWKNVSYDNIKSHKEPGIYPRLRKYSFGAAVFWPSSLFRVNIFMDIMFIVTKKVQVCFLLTAIVSIIQKKKKLDSIHYGRKLIVNYVVAFGGRDSVSPLSLSVPLDREVRMKLCARRN